MSVVKAHRYWECDICADTIKVKGGVYPRKLGFRLIKKIGKAIGWNSGDITYGSDLENLDFCIECWEKVVTAVHRMRRNK